VREAAIGQGAIDARSGGQVGWAVVSVWAGPGQGQKVAGPVEEGRGTRRSGRKGGPGRLGQTSQKGGSILVRFQVGFGPMRFRKISN
jgi:hypothetical protein